MGKYDKSNVYFDRLKRVELGNNKVAEAIVEEVSGVEKVPEGAIHWNLKKDRENVYVKCKGDKNQWVFFKEITLTGVGKVKAADFA